MDQSCNSRGFFLVGLKMRVSGGQTGNLRSASIWTLRNWLHLSPGVPWAGSSVGWNASFPASAWRHGEGGHSALTQFILPPPLPEYSLFSCESFSQAMHGISYAQEGVGVNPV